jgi:hypothetical protein
MEPPGWYGATNLRILGHFHTGEAGFWQLCHNNYFDFQLFVRPKKMRQTRGSGAAAAVFRP